MRSSMLGELEGNSTYPVPRLNRHRTSQASRRRFHRLSNSIPQPSPRHNVSYSTGSLPKTKDEPVAAFIPSTYCPTARDDEDLSPYNQFISLLTNHLHFKSNVDAFSEAFQRAIDAGVFVRLSKHKAIEIFQHLSRQIDSLCVQQVDSEVISKLGFQMEELYSSLSRETLDELKRGGEWTLIVCRFLAYMANFSSGLPYFLKYFQERNEDTGQVFDSMLLALTRHQGLGRALALWSTPEMKGILPSNAKFNYLVTREAGLKDAIEVMARWDRARRQLAARFCLEMAVRYKSTENAIAIIEGMPTLRVKPNYEHVMVICKELAAKGNVDKAKALFNTIPPSPQQFYSQTKLYIYARSGDPTAALKVLEERKAAGQFQIEDRSNILLSLSIAKKYKEMGEFFEASYPMSPDGIRSPVPPVRQYSICMLAHARAGDVERVNWWLSDMDKQGVKPNLQLFTHLITLFKKIGDGQAIMHAYNQMLQSDIRPDPTLFTVMLSYYANLKDSKAADALFMDAINQGIVPDEKMTSALMNVHIQSGSWPEAVRIFEYLSSKIGNTKPALSVYNTMFKAYLLLGAPFKVMARFFLLIKKMGYQPDSFTYSILVLSACEAGMTNVALEIVEEIKAEQRDKNRNDVLNTHIMTIVMSAFLRVNDKVRAKGVLDDMVSMGLLPTDITYGAIVRAYGVSRLEEDMKQAEQFVKKLLSAPEEMPHLGQSKGRKQPIANLYLPLMATPSENGDVDEVERLYSEFLRAGGRPSVSLYHKLLLAYRQANSIQKTVDIWPLVERLAQHEIPFVEPHEDGTQPIHMAHIQAPLSVYLDTLSKFGMHVEVANTWHRLQKNKFIFDAQNWNHLVVVLVRAGQLPRAFEVMESVLLPKEGHNKVNARIAYEWRKLQGKIKPDPLDSYLPVFQGTPMWGSEDRVRIAQIATSRRGKSRDKGIDIDEIDKSFSYPIRVLEFIRPGWNDWSPHEVVWRALLVVTLQLDRGYVPKPLKSGGELLQNVTVQDISERNPEGARNALKDLESKYPTTMERVLKFYDKEKKRLSEAEFERLYIQH